jgi:hypothetical protein
MREIRNLLRNGSDADMSHAIEMLDHFVYEDIKPVLFPVIENISVKERVKRLQYYFPIESMTVDEMISSTLTRDYNLLSISPRIYAMELALDLDSFEVNQELIANVFHPNKLLREVAALVVHKKDPDQFENVFSRLDPEIQYQIGETMENLQTEKEMLLVERFNFIRNIDRFAGLPEDILIVIAQSFYEKKYVSGEVIDLKEMSKEMNLLVMITGSAELINNEGSQYELTNTEVYYGELLVSSGIEKISINAQTTFLAMNSDTIDLLLFDYSEIANCLLNCVEQFKLAG